MNAISWRELETFLTVTGFVSAWAIVPALNKRVWHILVPGVFLLIGCAWFVAILQSGPAFLPRFLAAVIGWPLIALAGTVLRQRLSPTPSSSSQEIHWGDCQKQGDPEFIQAFERFLQAGQQGDIATIREIYAPEFQCLRVADSGGSVRLPRDKMLHFWEQAISSARPNGLIRSHAIPTRNTRIWFLDSHGTEATILMTRQKRLQTNWENLFYVLRWVRQNGEWKLLREYVHQKSS
ncbi:MAG: nuclear transport factor 2 family protein [Armatimonas sp.]